MANEPQNKPTAEELKAKEEEAIKAAEELEGRQQIPKDEEEEEPDPEPEPSKPAPDPESEEEEAEPSKELYKKKFSASSKENQRINAKNRVINKALAEAEDVPEPTEDELTKEYPDWEMMSDIEKTLAKETVVSRNWRKMISEAKEQATKIEKWNESVEEFVTDPKTLSDNPELEGKTEEFQEFATQETNNNVPFTILVGAFLHQRSTQKPNNKGRMFERGSGGSNEKPQPKKDTITLEEARVLREKDYNKWKEMLAAGKIEQNL